MLQVLTFCTANFSHASKHAQKDLNALIDKRILALKKNPKKEGKQVTFSSLKEAHKYIAAKKNNKDDSFSDEE